MSRTRKATVAAGFGYAQFGLSLIVGIALVPLLLSHLGTRTWGVWLATGELLAYAGMVDLGVLGVLPWLLAEADGRGDRAAMRRLISNSVAVGALVGCAYLLIAAALWQVLPSTLRLTPVDRATVGPPLAIVVTVTALTYPLRVFPAVLIGLQDMTVHGTIRVAQSVLNVVLTVVLLLQGYGLYALAWASVGPTLLGVVVSAIRLRRHAPDLLQGWTWPVAGEMKFLLGNGFGVWLGAFGWLLLSSSNAIVIAALGQPEWIAVFACTAKVSIMATQLVWLLPDSGLIGLAQLSGLDKGAERVRHLVGLLQQMHLLLAGAAACAVLAFNPTFVTEWVGAPLFGGLALNGLLAMGIVLYSLAHGLVTVASVLGSRVQVGVVTVANGMLQVAAAYVLGSWLGLPGVALGGLLGTALTSVPAGAWLLRRTIRLSLRSLVADQVMGWAVRMLPIAAAAALVGVLRASLGFWAAGLATAAVLLAYVWHMRPLYGAVLALDPRWTPWFAMVRLVPVVDRSSESAAVPAVHHS